MTNINMKIKSLNDKYYWGRGISYGLRMALQDYMGRIFTAGVFKG